MWACLGVPIVTPQPLPHFGGCLCPIVPIGAIGLSFLSAGNLSSRPTKNNRQCFKSLILILCIRSGDTVGMYGFFGNGFAKPFSTSRSAIVRSFF